MPRATERIDTGVDVGLGLLVPPELSRSLNEEVERIERYRGDILQRMVEGKVPRRRPGQFSGRTARGRARRS